MQSTVDGPTQFLHFPEHAPRHMSQEDPVHPDKQVQAPSKFNFALLVQMTQFEDVGPMQLLHFESQIPI